MLRPDLRPETLIMENTDWSRLMDICLDTYNSNSKENPIVDYMEEKTGWPRNTIIDCFNYYRAFGAINSIQFTKLIFFSEQGFPFWFELYNTFQPKHIRESIFTMAKKISQQLK